MLRFFGSPKEELGDRFDEVKKMLLHSGNLEQRTYMNYSQSGIIRATSNVARHIINTFL